MESKTSLKQRLSRLFRPSAMLRTSCSSTTSGNIFSPSSSSANTSNRRSVSTAAATDNIARDPVFIPHDSLFLLPANTTTLLDRSLSFSSSSRLLSLGCGGGCRPTKAAVDATTTTTTTKSTDSKKKERRVRETGELYETAEREGKTCPPASPFSPSKDHSCEKKKKKKNKDKATINNNKKKKVLTNPYGFSSSPDDDDDGSEFFSSDDEDVAETFFSSRNFSSDSSEFYKRPSSQKKNKNKKGMKQSTTTARSSSSSSRRRPPRRRRNNNNNFRPVVSVEEEEERSGIAVMKRSSDPYVDFRNSMVEMIVERQIFGAKDLERLLRSYLSLNSPSHHSVILGAFADISQVLFGH